MVAQFLSSCILKLLSTGTGTADEPQTFSAGTRKVRSFLIPRQVTHFLPAISPSDCTHASLFRCHFKFLNLGIDFSNHHMSSVQSGLYQPPRTFTLATQYVPGCSELFALLSIIRSHLAVPVHHNGSTFRYSPPSYILWTVDFSFNPLGPHPIPGAAALGGIHKAFSSRKASYCRVALLHRDDKRGFHRIGVIYQVFLQGAIPIPHPNSAAILRSVNFVFTCEQSI